MTSPKPNAEGLEWRGPDLHAIDRGSTVTEERGFVHLIDDIPWIRDLGGSTGQTSRPFLVDTFPERRTR